MSRSCRRALNHRVFAAVVAVAAASFLPPVFAAAQTAPAAQSATPAAFVLLPTHVNYEVQINSLPFKARAEQILTPLGGDRWRMELRLNSFLLDTVEAAEFHWDNASCHSTPERYSYTRKGVGKNRQLEQRFDFAAHVVTRNDGKHSDSFPLPDGVEDKLSHSLGLACRIARGARGNIAADVAWDSSVQHFEYVVSSTEETVETPSGNWPALRFERKRAPTEKRVTTTWLAATAGWQAVKMQHTEGDGYVVQLRMLDLTHPAAATP